MRRSKRHLAYKHEMTGLHFRTRFVTFVRSTSIGRRKPCALIEKVEHHRRVFNARETFVQKIATCEPRAGAAAGARDERHVPTPRGLGRYDNHAFLAPNRRLLFQRKVLG